MMQMRAASVHCMPWTLLGERRYRYGQHAYRFVCLGRCPGSRPMSVGPVRLYASLCLYLFFLVFADRLLGAQAALHTLIEPLSSFTTKWPPKSSRRALASRASKPTCEQRRHVQKRRSIHCETC